MPLPELTALQFLVLDILGAKERPGRHIREKLKERGEGRTLASFYQAMARLEEEGMLEGSNHRIVSGDQIVTERRYKILGKGIKAHTETLEFYRSRPIHGVGTQGVGR